MVKRAVRGFERRIGGSRGQLESLIGPMRIWGPARGSGGSSWGDGKTKKCRNVEIKKHRNVEIKKHRNVE